MVSVIIFLCFWQEAVSIIKCGGCSWIRCLKILEGKTLYFWQGVSAILNIFCTLPGLLKRRQSFKPKRTRQKVICIQIYVWDDSMEGSLLLRFFYSFYCAGSLASKVLKGIGKEHGSFEALYNAVVVKNQRELIFINRSYIIDCCSTTTIITRYYQNLHKVYQVCIEYYSEK